MKRLDELNHAYTSVEGLLALEENGFSLSPFSETGWPTPGRVGDRISDIVSDLRSAVENSDIASLTAAICELDKLRMALDCYTCRSVGL